MNLRIDQERQTQGLSSNQEQDSRKATIPVEFGAVQDTISSYKKDDIPSEAANTSRTIKASLEMYEQSQFREDFALKEIHKQHVVKKTLDQRQVCVKERLNNAEAKASRTNKVSTVLSTVSALFGIGTVVALVAGAAPIALVATVAMGVASIANGVTKAFQAKYSAEAGQLRSDRTQIGHQQSTHQEKQHHNMEYARGASEERPGIFSRLIEAIQNRMRAARLK